MKKHGKQSADYFDGSVFLWQLRLCQYSHNACMIVADLSSGKS